MRDKKESSFSSSRDKESECEMRHDRIENRVMIPLITLSVDKGMDSSDPLSLV